MFPYRMFFLANDLYIDALTFALRHGLDDGADLFCDPTLPSDDLTHVFRRNTKRQSGFLPFDLR